MKGMWMAGILVGMLASCERKDEQSAAEPHPASDKQGIASVDTGVKESGAGEVKPGKTSERPVLVKKKQPVAEPVADHPGFVKSPFSGKMIDVRGIPAGTLVADPMFPAEEEKHFRVPELSPEDQATLERESSPEGKPVPGRAGYIFSPYDNKIIDVTDIPAGTLVADPSAPAGEVRYIKVPGDKPAILDPTKLIGPPTSEEP